MALPEIRSNVKGAKVGITLNLNTAIPASPSEYDKKACTFFDNMFNRLFLEPLYNSKYPTELFDELKERGEVVDDDLNFLQEGDLDIISEND